MADMKTRVLNAVKEELLSDTSSSNEASSDLTPEQERKQSQKDKEWAFFMQHPKLLAVIIIVPCVALVLMILIMYLNQHT